MYPYPYPYPVLQPRVIPTHSERRLRECHARNIGQIEGYGAAVRDMMAARAAQKLREVEAKAKEGTKKETPKSTPKLTQSAQEKYREYKKTKEEKEKKTFSKSKTDEDAFEKYQHYKDKHYEYRSLLQEDPKSSRKEATGKESSRGCWDSTTAETKSKKTQPKDSSDLRREKLEREEYYQRQREEESRARYYEQRRAEEEARRQDRIDRYAYEHQLRERRRALEADRGDEEWGYAAAVGGQFVRAGPRPRGLREDRQVWWGERR